MSKPNKDKPENLIQKSFPAFFESKQDESGNDLGIVGAFVAVMGNIDYGDDIISNGAFKKTISERASKIRVLDNHNSWSVEDALAKLIMIKEVGRDELPEKLLLEYPDATGGLYTEFQFILEEPNDKSAAAFRRIKHGLIDEYSIGFEIIKSEWRDIETNEGKRNVRVIQEIKLWEVSPVVFAMNPATATVGAKNKDNETASTGGYVDNGDKYVIHDNGQSPATIVPVDMNPFNQKVMPDGYQMAVDDVMCMNCRNFHGVTKNLGYCKSFDTTVTANYKCDGYTQKATMLSETMASDLMEFLSGQVAKYSDNGVWSEDDTKIVNEMFNNLIEAFLGLLPNDLLAREMPDVTLTVPKKQENDLDTRAESQKALTPDKRKEASQRIAEMIEQRYKAKRK